MPSALSRRHLFLYRLSLFHIGYLFFDTAYLFFIKEYLFYYIEYLIIDTLRSLCKYLSCDFKNGLCYDIQFVQIVKQKGRVNDNYQN